MILLYSTGFDSEIYRQLLQPEKLMFFYSGARYQDKEAQQLQRLVDEGIITQEVITDHTLNFSSLEGSNSVVPMRNIFYLLRAFEYSDEVALGVTYYDFHLDKQTDVHNALTSFIQNYYYFREDDIPENWETVHPKILTPYRHLTKGQALKLMAEKGIDIEYFKNIRTCYSEHSEKGCGACLSCLHKAMALAVNGLYSKNLFDKDPRFVVKDLDLFLEQYKFTFSVDVFKREFSLLL